MDDGDDQRPGSGTAPLWDPGAIPAATVVVLRDRSDGVEVLMLRRDRALSFAGGMWVFPGGRIDPDDHPAGGSDLEAAARTAAAREAAEEAGLVLDPSTFGRWSHWTPPPESPKRFSTAFFVAALPDGAAEVIVDDGEICEHRWLAPAEVLALHRRAEVGLTPPTFITLWHLQEHVSVGSVLAAADRITAPEHFATRIAVQGEEIVALYHGDAGYELVDPTIVGPRHRLVMGTGWSYERSG